MQKNHHQIVSLKCIGVQQICFALLQVSKKPEGPERRLSHDKGPAPKPPNLPAQSSVTTPTKIEPPLSLHAGVPEPTPLPAPPCSVIPTLLDKTVVESASKLPAKQKSNQIIEKAPIPVAVAPPPVVQEVEERADNTSATKRAAEVLNNRTEPKPLPSAVISTCTPPPSVVPDGRVNGGEQMVVDEEDRRMPSVLVNKRPPNKVAASTRPVSMVNNIAENKREKDLERMSVVDETDRIARSRRSNSVSNRNRRQASPPPLDRVLQIQASDKILNRKDALFGSRERNIDATPICSYEDDRVGIQEALLKSRGDATKPSKRGELASNISISSG